MVYSHQNESGTNQLARMVDRLQDPSRFDHSVDDFETVETHISIVLLTGPIAYKFKKPLDLEFLDFSTLDQRHDACQTELQLNRRTAPDLYLDVVPITGSIDEPELNGEGEVIEYSVKMKQFPPSARFDRVVQRGEGSDEHIDDIADQLADVHDGADSVWTDQADRRPVHVREEVEDTFQRVQNVTEELDHSTGRVRQVGDWLIAQVNEYRDRIIRRTGQGFVRDLHGDLHLENIAWMNDRAVFFDCIEFNASYRQIDVINELAFLAMDLGRVGERELSWRLVNRYLEHTGDYEGVALLPLFKTYRAMVRAMVAGLKSAEEAAGDQCPEPSETMEQFLTEMCVPMNRGPSLLVLMHGLSGSGKTTVSQQLIQRMGGIRIRSDVERKRLFGVEPYGDRPVSDVSDEELYSDEANRRTYNRLRTLAEDLLDTGYPVFVDATFLRRARRRSFFELGRDLAVPARLLYLDVSEQELRRRLQNRASERVVSDADEDVLGLQMHQRDPLTSDERERTITVDGTDISYPSLVSRLEEVSEMDT